MKRAIAVFGGSFNPPGLHHRALAEMLSAHFDEVLVVPCGPRQDKPVTDDVPPIYRAAMAEMTFRGLAKVRIELFDLEESTFTRTWELEQRFREQGEPWHVAGADLVAGGGQGESVIQREWAKGPEIWRRLNFAVVLRPGRGLVQVEARPTCRSATGCSSCPRRGPRRTSATGCSTAARSTGWCPTRSRPTSSDTTCTAACARRAPPG